MLEVGQKASIERCFDAADIEAYVALGGAPAADDEIPHALMCALFSYLLGVELPGTGTNYLKQQTEFFMPARMGEAIRATVEITRIRADKQLVDLATQCRATEGRLLCSGRALVYVRDVDQALETQDGR